MLFTTALLKTMISVITTIVLASILDLILENKKSVLVKDSHRWLWVNWVGSAHVCDGLEMETCEYLNSESHTGNGQGASQTSPSKVWLMIWFQNIKDPYQILVNSFSQISKVKSQKSINTFICRSFVVSLWNLSFTAATSSPSLLIAALTVKEG